MRNKLLKSLFGLGLMLIALQSFAKVELTLQDLRKEVLNENLDVKIQYEKYYQSQKGVSVALGQFLPNANINLININATMAVLQSVVPTPENWFAYQASKELRTAEMFTSESIKLNILEGLTVNYINIKHQESLMSSLKVQEVELNAVYEEVKKKEELGTATASEVFAARRDLLQHRQDIFALETLMITERQALLIALNRSPSEELVLAALPADNMSVIPAHVEDAADLAVSNSTELLSNEYQAEAAAYMVSSKRWSFISFTGIGFSYGGNLAIEKSKARVIALQAEQIELKIRNQVYAAYEALDLLDERISLQGQMVESVKKMYARNQELYLAGMLTFTKLNDSKNEVISEERALVKLQMDKKVKIAQLKRLLGLDSSLNGVNVEQYKKLQLVKTEDVTRRGTKQVWLTVNGDKELMNDVFSVTYTVENLVTETRMLAAETNLTLYFKVNVKGQYKVTAKIRLLSGDVITKEELVVLR